MGSFRFLSSLVSILFLSSRHLVTAAGEWSYSGDHGPTHWQEFFPKCGGQSQSPVPIETANVFVDRNLTEFRFDGYDAVERVNMSLTNNGHTVQVGLDGKLLSISGGGLEDSYIAAQLHFHWGFLNSRGSEHTLDGKQYPMEMHIVHYSSKYSSLKEAMDKPKGLKVLGFFFEIASENKNFEHIISHFHEIAHKDDHVNIDSVPLRSLLPDDLSIFYRYHGSLTTPPCYESVIWTLFKETIKVSERQLHEFRDKVKENIATEPDRILADDFRPVQPLNHRIVFANSILARDPKIDPTGIKVTTHQTSNQIVLDMGKNSSSKTLQSFSFLILLLSFSLHVVYQEC